MFYLVIQIKKNIVYSFAKSFGIPVFDDVRIHMHGTSVGMIAVFEICFIFVTKFFIQCCMVTIFNHTMLETIVCQICSKMIVVYFVENI